MVFLWNSLITQPVFYLKNAKPKIYQNLIRNGFVWLFWALGWSFNAIIGDVINSSIFSHMLAYCALGTTTTLCNSGHFTIKIWEFCKRIFFYFNTPNSLSGGQNQIYIRIEPKNQNCDRLFLFSLKCKFEVKFLKQKWTRGDPANNLFLFSNHMSYLWITFSNKLS